MQAAQAMSQYAGWEPKEFTEAQAEPPQSTWQPQEYDDSQDAAQQQQQQAAASTSSMHWQQQQASGDWQQGQGQKGQSQGRNTAQVHSWQQGQDQGQAHDWQSQQQQPQQLLHQLPGDNSQPHTHWAHHQADQQQQQQSWPNQAEAWQQQQQEHQAPGTDSTGEDGQNLMLHDQHQLPPQQSREQQGQSQPVATDALQQTGEGGSMQAGFVYDSASGYWHDAASGYYYDANTGLYCHAQTQQWYTQDAATGEFTPFVSEQAISGAAANALGECVSTHRLSGPHSEQQAYTHGCFDGKSTTLNCQCGCSHQAVNTDFRCTTSHSKLSTCALLTRYDSVLGSVGMFALTVAWCALLSC